MDFDQTWYILRPYGHVRLYIKKKTGRIYIYLAQKICQLQLTNFKMREEKSPQTDTISIKIP
jgi:hypothetical protein